MIVRKPDNSEHEISVRCRPHSKSGYLAAYYDRAGKSITYTVFDLTYSDGKVTGDVAFEFDGVPDGAIFRFRLYAVDPTDSEIVNIIGEGSVVKDFSKNEAFIEGLKDSGALEKEIRTDLIFVTDQTNLENWKYKKPSSNVTYKNPVDCAPVTLEDENGDPINVDGLHPEGEYGSGTTVTIDGAGSNQRVLKIEFPVDTEEITVTIGSDQSGVYVNETATSTIEYTFNGSPVDLPFTLTTGTLIVSRNDTSNFEIIEISTEDA